MSFNMNTENEPYPAPPNLAVNTDDFSYSANVDGSSTGQSAFSESYSTESKEKDPFANYDYNKTQSPAPWNSKYMGISIASMFCCNWWGGTAALIFTILSNCEYKLGNFDKAEHHRKWAFGLLIATAVLSLICCAGYTILYTAGMISAFN